MTVSLGQLEWVVFKRYSEFKDMHKQVQLNYFRFLNRIAAATNNLQEAIAKASFRKNYGFVANLDL